MELRIMRNRWTVIALATSLLLPLTASAIRAQSDSLTQTEEFHQTYPLSADGRVSLSNINGRVKISGWDRNEVRVDAVKRGRTAESLKRAQIKVNTGPSSIHIETEYDQDWRDERGERHHAALVEYTLSVPRTAR